jgi:plastocyanin
MAVEAGGGLPSAFSALAPCYRASDYVAGPLATISFGGSLGHQFSPACAAVPIGGVVTFSGDFGSHPLHASTRGSPGSPITGSSAGTVASFSFPQVGFYPFYCQVHGDDAGGGMAGVIEVTP